MRGNSPPLRLWIQRKKFIYSYYTTRPSLDTGGHSDTDLFAGEFLLLCFGGFLRFVGKFQLLCLRERLQWVLLSGNPSVLGGYFNDIFRVILFPLTCPACEVRLWDAVGLGKSTRDVLNLPLTKHYKVSGLLSYLAEAWVSLGTEGCWQKRRSSFHELARRLLGQQLRVWDGQRGSSRMTEGIISHFPPAPSPQHWKVTAGSTAAFWLSGNRVLKARGSAEFLNML